MRMYGFLKEPYKCNKNKAIYKVIFTDELDEMGWIEIGDPLPYCQHDCLLPIRVKGRNTGQPQWGKFEILSDGQWIEYKLPEID